jgi:hypothetical protein
MKTRETRLLVDSSVSPAALRLVNNGVCRYHILFYRGCSNLRLHGVPIEYEWFSIEAETRDSTGKEEKWKTIGN